MLVLSVTSVADSQSSWHVDLWLIRNSLLRKQKKKIKILNQT